MIAQENKYLLQKLMLSISSRKQIFTTKVDVVY
jgi:hypothetical protein